MMVRRRDSVPAELLQRRFELDEQTGAIIHREIDASVSQNWRAHNKTKAGLVAGTLNPNGYVVIGVATGLQLSGHVIAWALWAGQYPAGSVDHINGVRYDNRPCNLRDIPQWRNTQNGPEARRARSADGFRGLTYREQDGLSRAEFDWRGRRIHLGPFQSRLEMSAECSDFIDYIDQTIREEHVERCRANDRKLARVYCVPHKRDMTARDRALRRALCSL